VRENQKKQEAVEDMIFSTTLKEQERAISSVEQDHARQKRVYMKQLYEDNKRLEEYRAKTKKEQEEKEKYLARNQVEFFDRNKSYR
jgi:anion-transporting  ArsA/GET3 family ATPase